MDEFDEINEAPEVGKTQFLGLHDWQPTDCPTTEDWAGDNRKIDEAVKDLDTVQKQIERDLNEFKANVEEEYVPFAGGELTGELKAASPSTVDGVKIRNIACSSIDLEAGSSPLSTGQLYFVYE